jgi:hypothetical protein
MDGPWFTSDNVYSRKRCLADVNAMTIDSDASNLPAEMLAAYLVAVYVAP